MPAEDPGDELHPFHVALEVTVRGSVIVRAPDAYQARRRVLDDGEGVEEALPWSTAWELEDWHVLDTWPAGASGDGPA